MKTYCATCGTYTGVAGPQECDSCYDGAHLASDFASVEPASLPIDPAQTRDLLAAMQTLANAGFNAQPTPSGWCVHGYNCRLVMSAGGRVHVYRGLTMTSRLTYADGAETFLSYVKKERAQEAALTKARAAQRTPSSWKTALSKFRK